MGSTNGVLLPIPELTEAADGPKLASDLANSIEDYFFDRIISAGAASAGVVRYLPYHWGAGTTFPYSTAGAREGDLYRHTGLGCTMRCITAGTTQANGVWKQAETSVVASAAARLAISTNYAAQLHDGFRVYQQDTRMHWYWNVASGTWLLQPAMVAWSWRPDNAPNETVIQTAPKMYYGYVNGIYSNLSYFVTSIGYASAGFTEVPIILLGIGGENAASIWVGSDSATTTGATIVGRSGANINLTAPVSFLVIGK